VGVNTDARGFSVGGVEPGESAVEAVAPAGATLFDVGPLVVAGVTGFENANCGPPNGDVDARGGTVSSEAPVKEDGVRKVYTGEVVVAGDVLVGAGAKEFTVGGANGLGAN